MVIPSRIGGIGVLLGNLRQLWFLGGQIISWRGKERKISTDVEFNCDFE